jgi:hypothetical protein
MPAELSVVLGWRHSGNADIADLESTRCEGGGSALPCGGAHFLPEEAPEETCETLIAFFAIQ